MIRGRAKSTTQSKQKLVFMNRLGVIINGTGSDHAKIRKLKQELESIGYETAMIFVNTTDAISRERNIERGQRGGREVPEHIRKEKYDESQRNISVYSQLFSRFVIVDNSKDIRNLDNETKKEIQKSWINMHRFFRKFIAKPVRTRSALAWIEDQKNQRNITDTRRSRSHRFEDLEENYGLDFSKLSKFFTKRNEKYYIQALKDYMRTAPKNKSLTKQRIAADIARLYDIPYRGFLDYIRKMKDFIDTDFQIEDVFDNVKINSNKYNIMIEIMEQLSIDELKDLSEHPNVFVSSAAKNRLVFLDDN